MKILFFDIDGTLTDESTGQIPQSCKEALKQAQKNGHLCFVNTGRPISTIPNKIFDLNLDGYICGCGCYIKYKNEVLLESTLTNSLCKEIVNQLVKANISGVLEGSQNTYWPPNDQNPTVTSIKANHTNEGFDTSKTWFDENLQYDKATCWLNPDSDFEIFHQFMSQHFVGIKRGEDFYEYIQKDYSKATGIQFLLDYFGLNIEDAYAFGDSTNDLSMLEYVKNSTAMGNSQEIVKKSVAYITTDANKNGIKNALEYWGII